MQQLLRKVVLVLVTPRLPTLATPLTLACPLLRAT